MSTYSQVNFSSFDYTVIAGSRFTMSDDEKFDDLDHIKSKKITVAKFSKFLPRKILRCIHMIQVPSAQV